MRNEQQTWLLDLAHTIKPGLSLPDSFELADNAVKRWQQIARLCRVSTQQLAEAASQHFEIPLAETGYANLNVVRILPEKTCRQLLVVPVQQTDDELIVATCDPINLDEIRSVVSFALPNPLAIRFQLMLPEVIENTIVAAFSPSPLSAINLDEVSGSGSYDADLTVRLAKAILREAVKKRASDIHIQPFSGGGMIRFRIDGVMQRIGTVSLGTLENLVRFFKVQGKMDPATHMVPQDGRLRLSQDRMEIDIRLSILPTFGGERIVARLLDQNRIFSMRRSGYSVSDQQAIKRLTANRSGIVLITGPTGSGKSSTLYSILSDMDRAEQNIMSIENPVEYVLQGISQTEVNEKQGLTFAGSLRSILRQDPDVVLIGEIRDSETALIATQAALTGHLVLSTLHTNDAVTAIPRLLRLGVDASILADSLIGVVAQRLVRQLCPDCKERVTEQTLTPLEKLFKDASHMLPGYRAVGCEKCTYTGYRGRLPITEIFEVSAEIAQMINAGKTTRTELIEASRQYKRLAVSAALLVVSGDTTIDEAYRIVGRDFWFGVAKEYGAELPDTLIIPERQNDVMPGILVIADDRVLYDELSASITGGLYQGYVCRDAKEAKEILRQQVNIVFVVMDVGDVSPDVAIKKVRDARVELYWSKLPALLILPQNSADMADQLREDGAISKMLPKPVTASQIMGYIESYTLEGGKH